MADQYIITVRTRGFFCPYRYGHIVFLKQTDDPCFENTTRIGVSRWDLFKGLFKRQAEIFVQVSLDTVEQRGFDRQEPEITVEERV